MSTMDETEPLPNVSPWRRRLTWLGAALAVLVLAGVAWLLHTQRRDAGRLQRALAELDADDPGWRAEDMLAARAELPPTKNSARVVVDVWKMLSRSFPSQDLTRAIEEVSPPV